MNPNLESYKRTQFTPAAQPDYGDLVICLIDDQWAEGGFILELSVEPTAETMAEGFGWYNEPGNCGRF